MNKYNQLSMIIEIKHHTHCPHCPCRYIIILIIHHHSLCIHCGLSFGFRSLRSVRVIWCGARDDLLACVGCHCSLDLSSITWSAIYLFIFLIFLWSFNRPAPILQLFWSYLVLGWLLQRYTPHNAILISTKIELGHTNIFIIFMLFE